jgi:hypothetical protein
MAKDNRPPRERYMDFFNTEGGNIFGTGLTLAEFTRLGFAERIERSWVTQTNEEQKRRLQFILELAVELAKVREQTNFSTGLAESAIEAIITGDWILVESYAELFCFDGEDGQLRDRYGPIYARFVELLNNVLLTRERGAEA